jgi:hypothetical protein
MHDFPLTSIFNYAAAAICLVTAVKMYFVSREKTENIKITYFFYSFIFISLYLFANGLPLIVLKDSFVITVIISLFRPFLLIGGMFLCLIPLNFTKFKKFEKGYVYVLLFVVLASSTLTFLGLGQVGSVSGHAIENWARPDNDFIVYAMLLTGAVLAASFFFSVVFYFNYAVEKRKNKIASGKALMIGIGSLFFLLAVIFNYMYGVTAERFLFANTVASIMFMVGAVSFISSVTYKAEKEKISSKKY